MKRFRLQRTSSKNFEQTKKNLKNAQSSPDVRNEPSELLVQFVTPFATFSVARRNELLLDCSFNLSMVYLQYLPLRLRVLYETIPLVVLLALHLIDLLASS